MAWFHDWNSVRFPAGSAVGTTTKTGTSGTAGCVRLVSSSVTVVGGFANTMIHGVEPETLAPVSAASTSAAVAFQAIAAEVVPSTVRVKVPPVALPTVAS